MLSHECVFLFYSSFTVSKRVQAHFEGIDTVWKLIALIVTVFAAILLFRLKADRVPQGKIIFPFYPWSKEEKAKAELMLKEKGVEYELKKYGFEFIFFASYGLVIKEEDREIVRSCLKETCRRHSAGGWFTP